MPPPKGLWAHGINFATMSHIHKQSCNYIIKMMAQSNNCKFKRSRGRNKRICSYLGTNTAR